MFGRGSNVCERTSRRKISSDCGPLRRTIPIPLRPGGVAKATIVSASTIGLTEAMEELLSGCRWFQRDAEPAAVAVADGLSHEIRFFGQGQVNHPALAGIHRPKNKRSRCRPHLAGGVFSHGAQLRLTGCTIIIGVAHNALSLGQSSAVGLVDNMLKRFQQFTALIEQQTGVSSFN